MAWLSHLQKRFQESDDIEITVKKDGVYSFTVKDENDKEYTFDLNYNNGAAEVYSRDGINVVVGAKK